MTHRPSRRSILSLTLLAACATLLPASCGKERERTAGPVRAVVTIAPLAGLVRPLLPPEAEVRVLIPPGRSEHGYELSPGDLRALADADLVVYIGLGLEAQVERALKTSPITRRRVVEFASSVGIESDHDHHHDHDHHDHHDHGPIDPHLWLDPGLVEAFIPALARGAADACSRAGDARWSATQAGEALKARVRDLDDRFHAALAPHRGRAIVTHHAAFARLAERYGIEIAGVVRPIEGMEPTPVQLAKVVETIRAQRVRVVFVEPQYTSDAAERIAREEGLRLGRLDAVGHEDWFALMESNLDALVGGLADD